MATRPIETSLELMFIMVKLSPASLLITVLMGRGHHTHVDRDLAPGAQTLDDAFLKETKDLGLSGMGWFPTSSAKEYMQGILDPAYGERVRSHRISASTCSRLARRSGSARRR